MLFEVKEIDRKIYHDSLNEFLPDRIIDIHTHVWRKEDRPGNGHFCRTVTWPELVAEENPIEDLQETYRLLFPNKQVKSLIFPSIISHQDNIDGQNEYASTCSRQYDVPALIWSIPTWSSEELEEKIIAGGFVGLKCYLSHAPEYIPGNEIRIFDTFPHHQLEVLNKHGWVMMLHIPRPGRLGDPVNLAQMMEIDERYPNIKLIIAHVGRAYCTEDVGNAWDVLHTSKNMVFDFSANANEDVFAQLIENIGPKRICFGSDLPVLRMRTKRITENGRYVNLVSKGMYGDVSDDPNMREVDGNDAEMLTFFMYEELLAFRRAAERSSLNTNDLEDVFYNNAAEILKPLFSKL